MNLLFRPETIKNSLPAGRVGKEDAALIAATGLPRQTELSRAL
jgi:hypothetical protein